MHRGLVLEDTLVQHFVFLLDGRQAFFVTLVVFEFFHHLSAGVGCSDCLVFDFDLVKTTLLNQPLVLSISDLTLGSSFEFLPSLLFNHCAVGVEVLALELDLIEFFGETIFLSFLVIFLLFDLFENFELALFSSC